MDLAQATGVPETIDLGGEPRQVRLLTFKEWGVVTSWLKRMNPSPVTRALVAIQQAEEFGETIGPVARDAMLDHAQRAAIGWPPPFGRKEWLEMVEQTDGGLAKLLFEVLSKADPSFSAEQAEALAPRVTTDEWSDLLRVSLHGVHPHPKAAAPEDAPGKT